MALAWAGQRRLIYRPDPKRVPPFVEGLDGVAEVELATPDGARLVAWYAPPVGEAPTILYLHGNGGGLYDRSARVRHFQAAGHGVLMLAWRGYAGSTGRPSESANLADARLAHEWLLSQGIAARRIVLFGESLGTGVAVWLAAQLAQLGRPVAGVILDSPYSSLVDVAAAHFPYAPVRWILRDRYDAIAHIARIGAPMLILHGELDRVVPYALGRRLFEAAREPKRHVAFAGIGHLVPFDQRGWPVIRDFLDGLAAPRRAP